MASALIDSSRPLQPAFMFRRYAGSMRLIGHLRAGTALIFVVAQLECSPSRPVVGLTCPEPDWRAQTTPDSMLTFCAPPDLVQVKHSRIWTRAPAGSTPPFANDELFTLYKVSAADAFHDTETQPWPPSMLHDQGSRYPDSFEVTDYAVHWDSVGARIVRVETGHVTGGITGEHNKPMLEAAWMADSAHWVVVEALARTDSGLKDLSRVLRTIRRRR